MYGSLHGHLKGLKATVSQSKSGKSWFGRGSDRPWHVDAREFMIAL